MHTGFQYATLISSEEKYVTRMLGKQMYYIFVFSTSELKADVAPS